MLGYADCVHAWIPGHDEQYPSDMLEEGPYTPDLYDRNMLVSADCARGQ
jgi:hypothetical protein